jgi:hypothetical protein
MSSLVDVNLSSTDQDFIFVYSDPEAREFVENLWGEYREFADKDFAQKIPLEFHNRFWEMYLTCSLKRLGKDILPKTRMEGPDIEINNSGSRIWVEAVAASPGTEPNKISILEADQQWFRVPEDQIVLRYTATKFLSHGMIKRKFHISFKRYCHLAYQLLT